MFGEILYSVLLTIVLNLISLVGRVKGLVLDYKYKKEFEEKRKEYEKKQ